MRCPKPKRLIIERDDIADDLIKAGWIKVTAKAFRRVGGSQYIGKPHGEGKDNLALLPRHPLTSVAFDPRAKDWRERRDATDPEGKFARGWESIYVPGFADLDARWDGLNAGAEGAWMIFRPEDSSRVNAGSRTVEDAFVLFEHEDDAVLFALHDKAWS